MLKAMKGSSKLSYCRSEPGMVRSRYKTKAECRPGAGHLNSNRVDNDKVYNHSA